MKSETTENSRAVQSGSSSMLVTLAQEFYHNKEELLLQMLEEPNPE